MRTMKGTAVIISATALLVTGCEFWETVPDFGGHEPGDVLETDTDDVSTPGDDLGPDGDDAWLPDEILDSDAVIDNGFFLFPAVLDNPYAGLSAVVTFETVEPSIASVVVETEGMEPWVVPSGETEPVREHTVYVMGLFAETSYRMHAMASYGEIIEVCDEGLDYTTKPLPVEFPDFSTFVSRPELMRPGYTVIALHKLDLNHVGEPPRDFHPRLVTIDDAGRVVGYTKWSDPDTTLLGFTRLADGRFVMIDSLGVNLMDGKGEVVRRILRSDLGLDPKGVEDDVFLHHDVVALPDGGFAALGTALVPLESTAAEFDAAIVELVVEFTADGRRVSTVPLADFVDYSEGGGQFGGDSWNQYYPGWTTYDVMHANSLTYDPSDDSIIVGLHQSGTLLKYDRKKRRPVWIIGQDSTLPLNEGATWFTATHGPSLTPEGNLLVYDNGSLGLGAEQKKARAIEYRFLTDEKNDFIGVEQAWEYRNDFFSQFMGNAERLDNGNTLICNGFRIPSMEDFVIEASITEVTAGDHPEVVFDFRMERQAMDTETSKFLFFRAYRIDSLYWWHSIPPSITGRK